MNKLTGMSRKWWMGELTISFAVAFAFGIAVCATAADTRDYSTYVKLKADTTLGYDVVGAAFRVQPKRTPALAGCSGSPDVTHIRDNIPWIPRNEGSRNFPLAFGGGIWYHSRRFT